MPFVEVVMAKVADADKDASRHVGQCLGQSGLGRPCGQVEEHLLLTTKGCIRSRVVRRIPDGIQAGYHAEV